MDVVPNGGNNATLELLVVSSKVDQFSHAWPTPRGGRPRQGVDPCAVFSPAPVSSESTEPVSGHFRRSHFPYNWLPRDSPGGELRVLSPVNFVFWDVVVWAFLWECELLHYCFEHLKADAFVSYCLTRFFAFIRRTIAKGKPRENIILSSTMVTLFSPRRASPSKSWSVWTGSG